MTCQICLTYAAKWTARLKGKEWIVCDTCKRSGIRHKTAIRYAKLTTETAASESGPTQMDF